MAATIKDVAQYAQVNPSTVSRVIAGSSRISQRTKEKVWQAIKELGYHPNAIARSLAQKSSQAIGLIIARSTDQAFANPFFPEVIRGIGSVLEKEGYHLMLETASDRKKEKQITLQMLKSRRVDGVILTSSKIGDTLISRLIEEKFPFVLIGRPLDKNLREIDPVIWVNNDNVQLGMLATEHLIQQGCKKIAMINGPVDMVVSHDRRKGYLKALEIYGLAVNEDFIINVPFTEEGGAEAIDKMLSSGRVPDGIFAADDILALGAIEKLKDKGFSIPQNIAIVGVNNSVISRLVKPALTTVKIPIFDFGVQAALMLIESISCQGKEQFKPRHMIFPTELVVRESSIKG